MVYLIGTDHRAQHNGPPHNDSLANDVNEIIGKFGDYLLKNIKELNINLIAEDLSEEALCRKMATESIANSIAKEKGIEHRFCDPSKCERKALGIPSKDDIIKKLFDKEIKHSLTRNQKDLIRKEEQKYWHIRESFWLNKIIDKMHEPLIFICGSDHICRFNTLIINEGFEVTIVVHDWGRELLERYFNKVKDLNMV